MRFAHMGACYRFAFIYLITNLKVFLIKDMVLFACDLYHVGHSLSLNILLMYLIYCKKILLYLELTVTCLLRELG